MTVTNDEIIQAVFTASPENKSRALLILQGRAESPKSPQETIGEPLLLGMGDSAKLLGISRCTLWRLIKAGRLEKVEIYNNAYRLRRSDLLDLVNARTAGGPPASLSSDCCSPSSVTQEVPHG